jgi:hypothetical protein
MPLFFIAKRKIPIYIIYEFIGKRIFKEVNYCHALAQKVSLRQQVSGREPGVKDSFQYRRPNISSQRQRPK